MEIIFSDEAISDAAVIANYYAQESKSKKLAKRFYDQVWLTTELIASMPKMGAPIDTLLNLSETANEIQEILHATPLLDGIRRFPVKDFERTLLFYKLENQQIYIVRILHASRDLPTIFSMLEM